MYHWECDESLMTWWNIHFTEGWVEQQFRGRSEKGAESLRRFLSLRRLLPPTRRLLQFRRRRCTEEVWRDQGNLFGHVLRVSFAISKLPRQFLDLLINIQVGPSPGEPGLGWLWFGMFHHPAWAVGSYSSGHQARELPKSKSTQPRFARRWVTL